MDNASAQRACFGSYAMAGHSWLLRYNDAAPMSIKVTYHDGVFVPLDEVKRLLPGQRCTVFSDEELAEICVTLGWLEVAEQSFQFWNNAADDVYDET